MKKEESKKEKLTFKQRLKDKRERAKMELIFYGVFFIGVIIFAKILGSVGGAKNDVNNQLNSFVYSVQDNYEYDILLTIDDDIYHYYGRVLGNNSTINLKVDDVVKSYYLMEKKYYILENNNYILTDSEEVYPYIDYRYFNVDIIKEYLNIATKENNTYIIKLKDLLLNSDSEEYITIKIEEGDKNVVIDYTNLFKLTDENKEKVAVSITYSNIDNIISLENK